MVRDGTTSLVLDLNVGRTVCRFCGYEHEMSIFHLDVVIWDGFLGVTSIPRAFVDSIQDSIEAPLEKTDFVLEKRRE